MAKKKAKTLTKVEVVALFNAIATLKNEADGLRSERAELSLAKFFTASNSKNIVAYLMTAINPQAKAETANPVIS